MSNDDRHSVELVDLRVDAEGYDAEIRRFIPHYDDMIATGVELLAALAPPDAHMRRSGGCTGALSLRRAYALPGVRVTVLSIDPEMLAEAQTPGLAVFGERVSFREGSFLDPLPDADAVVASLSLHHIHDLSAKSRLYRAIHDALVPGGPLLNLYAAVTEGPRLNRLVFDRMAAWMGDHGISDAEARGHFAAWAGEDRYFPLEAEIGALREAGFDEVECF